MRKNKLLSMLLMVVFLAGVFILPPSAMADTANWGKVERVSGIFTGLSFPVTNTGPGTIVWRTDDITIQFNQYHATFGGDEVGLWGAHAGSGTISITAQQLAEKANTTVDVVRAEANNPSGGFILSATVRIYNKNTGPENDRARAIGTITDPSQIDTVIGPNHPTCGYTFPVADREAIATRWGVAYNPSPAQIINLKIDSLGLYTLSGQLAGATVEPGSYVLRAVFRNESTTTGKANFYAHKLGPIAPYASHARIDFAPGTITQEWNVSIVEGTNSFEADVDYPMDSNGNHAEEQFLVQGSGVWETNSNGVHQYGDTRYGSP